MGYPVIVTHSLLHTVTYSQVLAHYKLYSGQVLVVFKTQKNYDPIFRNFKTISSKDSEFLKNLWNLLGIFMEIIFS